MASKFTPGWLYQYEKILREKSTGFALFKCKNKWKDGRYHIVCLFPCGDEEQSCGLCVC